MHINIIVEPWRIKPNDERFDLSKRDEPVKSPQPKTQYLEHANSD
jgi:hypothetical protein